VVVELTGRKLKRAVNRLAFEGVMLETIFYFYFYFLSHNNIIVVCLYQLLNPSLSKK
jgi:hypothetical protein